MNDTIQFSDYFKEWLYGKEGYYSQYKEIGKEGDFFTAVSTSSFFGGAIGKKIIDTIEEGILPKNTTILEIGAHHGYLLADIIQFIYTLKPELLDTLNFAIVERFEHLQIQQKEYFRNSFGDAVNLQHYNDVNELDLENAFVVANEIFDAFPCELIYTDKEEKLQSAIVQNNSIEFKDIKETSLIEHCKKYKITKGEVGVGYEEFAQTICNNIKKFDFISFDYGELYPRNDFSCRVYAKHEVYPIFEENLDLASLFKNSDITYDVHFAHVIDSFENAGAKKIDYTTQLKALVNFGIIELLEILQKNVDESTYLREANKVKTLLTPTGMGDRFKMVYLRK